MIDTNQDSSWSVTNQDLHDELRQRITRDEPTVIARVVDVEGSAYRRPGAMMLVDGNADSVGAVTAGCLESPITDLATEVFQTNHPIVTTFDLTDDDGWGLGLGCNGIIDILLEPLDDSHWGTALEALKAQHSVALLTAVESDHPHVDIGDSAVLGSDGPVGPTATLPENILAELSERAEQCWTDGHATTVSVETEQGQVTVFIHGLVPSPTVLLFGHQNDIHPVAKLARQVGFRVIVASTRGMRANSEQFPNAHEVQAVHAPDLADVVEMPNHTYAVLMSHNLTDDALALESLLKKTELPYVGLMGPRKRFQEVQEESAITGVSYSEAELKRVSTPVGLDLGGGEPTQIALSIISEILAVHNDRDGGRLRAKNGPIHQRIEQSL